MIERKPLPLIAEECALPPTEMDIRLEQWRAALRGVIAVDLTSQAAGRLVLDLGPSVDLGEVARLCGLEVGCCSFFAFALTVSADGRFLTITVPSDALPALDELLQLLPGVS